MIEIENNKYKIITDYRNAFDKEEFLNKCTDYFMQYDYIVGDIAYSKLRLKGFYDSNNKLKNKINDIKLLDNYIKDYCAYGCKWFLIKKVK